MRDAAAKRKRAAIHTLGCRLNQSESHTLREQLDAAGYDVVPWGQAADLGIVNTCTVTAQADSKCRQIIRGFLRKNPSAYLAVTGCYSQMGTKEVAEIPGVDLIVGNQEKLNVLEYVGDAAKAERPLIVRDRIDQRDFSISFAGERPFNKRANLKVQDGCSFVCSFCIIPFARGPARSRNLANLLDEARQQASRGVRELVLTGVNIGTFVEAEKDIVGLVDALAALPGIDRLRISSIEPTTIPVALFDRMADAAHPLLPFLHIPLQSGSNRILREMRRRYNIEEWRDCVEAARERVPGMYVGTDVMVAFPGETEAEFQETCAVVAEGPVNYAHVFTYSERKGTVAARRPDHLPMEERHRRSAHLRRLADSKRHCFYSAHLGKEMRVLFEDPREGHAPGLTDNYIRVVVPHENPGKLANRLGRVRLAKVSADFVEGTLLEVLDAVNPVASRPFPEGRARWGPENARTSGREPNRVAVG